MIRKLQAFVATLMVAIPMSVAAQTAFTTRDVNVRAGPDQSYPLVARLQAGATVSVGGCLESYTWCDIYVGDMRGWIYTIYLTYPYQASRVPIYSFGPALGLPIITFSIGNYWDNYYRGRPFYGSRSYWASRRYNPPPPRFGRDWRPPPYRGNDDREREYNSQNYRPPHDNGNRPPHANRSPEHGGQNRPPRSPDSRNDYLPRPRNADGGEAGG